MHENAEFDVSLGVMIMNLMRSHQICRTWFHRVFLGMFFGANKVAREVCHTLYPGRHMAVSQNRGGHKLNTEQDKPSIAHILIYVIEMI